MLLNDWAIFTFAERVGKWDTAEKNTAEYNSDKVLFTTINYKMGSQFFILKDPFQLQFQNSGFEMQLFKGFFCTLKPAHEESQ